MSHRHRLEPHFTGQVALEKLTGVTSKTEPCPKPQLAKISDTGQPRFWTDPPRSLPSIQGSAINVCASPIWSGRLTGFCAQLLGAVCDPEAR